MTKQHYLYSRAFAFSLIASGGVTNFGNPTQFHCRSNASFSIPRYFLHVYHWDAIPGLSLVLINSFATYHIISEHPKKRSSGQSTNESLPPQSNGQSQTTAWKPPGGLEIAKWEDWMVEGRVRWSK